MEESKRDSGHHDDPFALHEILLSVNNACAIGYAVLVYLSKSQGSWTPKNDSTYFFLRSAYRVDDLLRLNSIGTVSTREVARQFPSRWSQVGAELLTVVTIFGVASLFVHLLRHVPESSLYRELLRYVGGATALFGTPACYLYVSRLTWNWAPDSLPLSGVVWLLYFRMPDTDSIATTVYRRAGRWTYFTAAFALAVLLFLWLPNGRTSVTHPKNMDSLTIQMSRGPCYGTCPSYTVTIHGSGSVEYVGGRYVKDRGPQVDRLGREQVIAVLQSLDGARFPALEDRAFTWCFDSASVGISVSADGSTKRVVSDSYCDGAKTGAQAQFVQAAHEIDAILDSKRWVSCDGP